MCSCAVKIWFIFTGVLEQFRKIVAGTVLQKHALIIAIASLAP